MRIAMSETFAEFMHQPDEAQAAFDRTADATVRWRIGELHRAIKTTPPGTLADCKLTVAVDTRIDGSREEDWVLLEQVGKYFDGGA